MSSPVVSWPPSHEQRAHLEQLAALIKQFGAARFTSAPLVRADERDFPDPWEATLTGVQQLLHRLCWHAHWDPDVEILDGRPAQPPDERMLLASEIELEDVAGGVVRVVVAAIGNDDVAGLLAHRVGQAFLELAPGDPFRGSGDAITETMGSVAAVYLGLGVLVANSSMYRRYASRIVARQVVEEQYVAEVGGLTIADATFLLAVQDLVRDDVPAAMSTLLGPQKEWVERWRDALEDHEDELRELLGLDEAPAISLSRPPAPRQARKHEERNLRHFNEGRTTFRVPVKPSWPMWLGGAAGCFGFLLPAPLVAGPALVVAGLVVGRTRMRTRYVCADSECGWYMESLVSRCPGCGGDIAETIAHANLRLERLEALGLHEEEDEHEHA